MIKRTRIKQHIQTNAVARAIYLLICIILMVVGLIGLYVAFRATERLSAYDKRNSLVDALVVGKSELIDTNYNYKTCQLNYRFTLEGKQYSQETSLENDANNYNCQQNTNSTIPVRYQKSNPHNNSYGDNAQAREELFVMSTTIAILGALSLGLGFIGLVAIRKSVKELHAREIEDSKKYYRRQAKVVDPEPSDTETETKETKPETKE